MLRAHVPLLRFRSSLRPVALHVALLASGAAALAYETSWTRMLHRVFGVGDLAVATVLAAFFFGLGLGSFAAARYAPRLRRHALAYAVLELAVAAYAFVSPWLVPSLRSLYVLVAAGDGGVALVSVVRLTLALLVLVPPTLLMGATLPVLARLVTSAEGWARGVTGLYVSNTLGAVAGVAAAGLWLIPSLGERATTWIAAAASAGAALLVLGTHHDVSAGAPTSAETVEPGHDGGEAETPSRALAVALAAMTGGASLAGEVLWTRVLRTVLHATTQAFAGMLVTYLLGIALGALIARRLARFGAARALGATQLLAAVLTAVAMVAAPHIVRLVPLLQGRLSFSPHGAPAILIVSGLLLFPLALVLGTGLPLAFGLAERAGAAADRGSGRLLAANTLAGLAGSLLAGFVLVPAMGMEASLFVVVFVHLAASGLALRAAAPVRSPARRSLALTGPLAVGVVLLLLRPSVDLPFLLRVWQEPMRAVIEGPGERWREPIVFLREGKSATVTVQRQPGLLRLFNDGRPESGFGAGPVGFGAELVLLGGLPTLFAEDTGRALAIGLGAGHTTTMLLAGGFERVDVVELEAAVVDAARLMHEARDVPFPLDDPRAQLFVDDARNRLALAADRSYDAVVSQPSHPWLAGSSALYTNEFFEEVDRVLTDGGVFALWVNLFRIEPRHVSAVVRTLREVFPHVAGFIVEDSSLVLAASRSALRWDERLDARIERLRERFLAHRGLGDRAALAAALELDASDAEAFGAGAPRIVDDRPMLELELARTPESAHVRPRDLDRILRERPWGTELSRSWEGPRAAMWVGRVERAEDRPLALARIERGLDHAGLTASERALVEGALAEARGRIQRALDAYDRAGTLEAAARADRLRLAEGRVRELLAKARHRAGLVASSPLLEAALLAGDAAAYETALAAAPLPETRELRAFVEAYAARGCAAWAERRNEAAMLARRHHAVAITAQACAFSAGDRDAAEELGTLAVRTRRAAALAAFERGSRCAAGHNQGCALALFRRALVAYPSHSASASALARLLHRRGRSAEAREVLLRTLREVEGIAESQASLAATAAELGLDLGVELPRAQSPSSTSTAVERGAAEP